MQSAAEASLAAVAPAEPLLCHAQVGVVLISAENVFSLLSG